jgi:hypothetical protein
VKRQAGSALLLVLVIIVLSATYLFVNQLNASNYVATRRERNAEVLNQAKQALIGYVAMRAGQTGENDPGSLPCPEPAAYYTSAANEGEAAGNCSLPAIGRLPWRTLGLDKLVDASGEPLWYVVSPGWHKPSPTVNTVINSNSPGQLTVDGLVNDAVALIIAPGPRMSADAAPGCAAVNQARSLASINVVNYLECDNATPADSSYVTNGPNRSFNDQVLRVTARDLLPGIEAAISQRIEREIAPALRSVYNSNTWGGTVSAANPMYPFAAPFGDPAVEASYRGSKANCGGGVCPGLFPAIFTNAPVDPTLPPTLPTPPCTPAAGSPCNPNFVQWTGGTIEIRRVSILGVIYIPGVVLPGLSWNPAPVPCTVATVGPPQRTELRCTAPVPGLSGENTNDVEYEIRATASNVGMVFRRFDTAGSLPGVPIVQAPTANMNTNGQASVTYRARTSAPAGSNLLSNLTCGLLGFLSGLECREATVTVPITLLADPPVLNPKHATLGWFMRNEWYRVLYYAAAERVTSDPLPGSTLTCGKNCLKLDTQAGTQDNIRTLLLLAGRSLTGTAGNTRTLADFLDTNENRNANERFETGRVNSTFNDRVIVVQTD